MTPDRSNNDADLAALWLGAITRDGVVRTLESIYARAASEIASRGPACWASGRCCNFERTGHRLYVTGLEAAYAITRASQSVTRADIDTAHARGGCPFQAHNLCGIHAIKPLGCRVYFCDRASQSWQQDLSERLLADIRALHASHAVEYRYGEWRAMLSMFAR
ncbi:MAG: YkgJ family cysteine cluster protein [Phycisphaerales bacterium]|nr:YkgJ family cysteine cluster protein [Phycisphaerales bacterium]